MNILFLCIKRISVSTKYWLKNRQFFFTIGNALRIVRCTSPFKINFIFRREIEKLRQIEMEMGKEMEKSETEIAERNGAKEIKKNVQSQCTV